MAFRSLAAVVGFVLVAAGGLAGDLLSKHHVFTSMLSKDEVRQEARKYNGHVSGTDKVINEAPHTDTPLKRALQMDVMPYVRFTLSTNPGVVFGWRVPPNVVAVVSVLTIALVVLFFATGDARAWSMHIGLGCILAGALGNLYDRLWGRVIVPGMDSPITHQVRDFIDLSEIGYRYIFNVADVLLVVGVFLLMVNWWITRKQTSKPATQAARN